MEILDDVREGDSGFASSMTKLWMCDRLLTLIRGGEGGERFDRGLCVLMEGEFCTDEVTLDECLPRELTEGG